MQAETAQERRQALVGAMLFGVIGIVLIVAMSLRVTPGMPTVALVFPPGYDAAATLDAVARADARIARFGGLGSVAVVARDGLDIDQMVARTGALAAINPLLPGACLSFGTVRQRE